MKSLEPQPAASGTNEDDENSALLEMKEVLNAPAHRLMIITIQRNTVEDLDKI